MLQFAQFIHNTSCITQNSV